MDAHKRNEKWTNKGLLHFGFFFLRPFGQQYYALAGYYNYKACVRYVSMNGLYTLRLS